MGRTNSTAGNSLTIDYSGVNRTVFTDNNGRSETYQFDNSGRPVCVCDQDGNAASYGYFKNFEDRGSKFKEYVLKGAK